MERLTHRMAWEVISKWACSRHNRQKRVMMAGTNTAVSDILGFTRDQVVLLHKSHWSIGWLAQTYPSFVKFLNVYLHSSLTDIRADSEDPLAMRR